VLLSCRDAHIRVYGLGFNVFSIELPEHAAVDSRDAYVLKFSSM
jgi:hypothetical protein